MTPFLNTPALFFDPRRSSPFTPRASMVVGIIDRHPTSKEPPLVHLVVFSNPDHDAQRVPVETVRAVKWLESAPVKGQEPSGAYAVTDVRGKYIVDLSKNPMTESDLKSISESRDGNVLRLESGRASIVRT